MRRYIIPYPQQPQYAFQYQWWIIQFELFIFVLTLGLTLFPRECAPPTPHRARPAQCPKWLPVLRPHCTTAPVLAACACWPSPD